MLNRTDEQNNDARRNKANESVWMLSPILVGIIMSALWLTSGQGYSRAWGQTTKIMDIGM